MCKYWVYIIIMGFFSSGLRGETYREKSTGIEFPDVIGSYKRGKISSYEAEPGNGGVAIEYRAEDAEVTVYTRNTGADSHLTSADYLKDSLAGIKELEKRGQYSNVKIYEFSPEKERANWKSAAFTSQSKDRFIISFIYCTVVSNHLVKIRSTTGNPKNEELQSFVKKLQDVVDHVSQKP